MIQVDNLCKYYGDRVAIEGVTFSVEKGQIMGFLGPNGAGKTTTMRILAGVMGATSGAATIAGHEVHDDPQGAKRRVGYLPEIPPVYRDMTVTDYVDYAARLHGVPRARRASSVTDALDKMHLGEVRGRLIGHLSKGFQQRVGLAQALVHNPDVLILDEPTVGLDPSQIIEIRHLIRALKGHHTIILSTHILPEVEMTCEKVVVINRGKIIRDGSLEALQGDMAGQVTLSLEIPRPSAPLVPGLQALPGVLEITPGEDEHHLSIRVSADVDPREPIIRYLMEGGYGLLELRRSKASLEDIFVQLTTVEQGVAA